MTFSKPLRSNAWFAGSTEVALMHRVALANSGITVDPAHPRPIIGILDSSSAINPCNLTLRARGEDAARGVREAGGIALILPTITLGEDLMKPTAMLYRALLSIEVEEYARAYPLDGLIILGNCDKSLPGALLGALSANLPTIIVNGGPRPAGRFRGADLGTGTALWRATQQQRAGTLDAEGWAGFERALACGPGSCNTMGTASSMAIVLEALGFLLPGSSTPAADDPRRPGQAEAAGRAAVRAVREERTPDHYLTREGLNLALTTLAALGGSTNVALHLAALAGRRALDWEPEALDEASRGTPVLADVEPGGRYLLAEFDAAGGVPALLHTLGDLIDPTLPSADGRPWSAHLRPADGPAIAPREAPVLAGGAFAVLRGNLAPRGALLRVSTAGSGLLDHRGPAVVFRDYATMVARCADPEFDPGEDAVLVLAGAGPVGAGMPEWGVIPIPVALARRGVTDMVRLSDARMSGTAFGTCVVHIAPEAAIGGPLGLLLDGDMIHLNVAQRSLSVDLGEAELTRRAAAWRPASAPDLRGWPLLHSTHVLQADRGADLDFLTAPTPEHTSFREPVIGLS